MTKKIFISFLILFLVFILYKSRERPVESNTMFDDKEVVYKNIESIEILELSTGENIHIDSEEKIKVISTELESMNSDHADPYNDSGNKLPIYQLFIVNTGRNANPPITIFEDFVVYRDKKQTLSIEDSRFLIHLIEDQFQ